MKEIEIRYQLDPQRKLAVVGMLAEMGWKPDASVQEDTYFCAKEYYESGTTKDCPYIMRVRVAEGKASLTYKSFQGGDGSSWTELETSVGDPEAAKAMLGHLGQKAYLVIKKQRLSGKLDDIELNIDAIVGLGDYLELEVMTSDAEKGRRRLIEIGTQLGLSEDDVVTKGYVQLMEERLARHQQ